MLIRYQMGDVNTNFVQVFNRLQKLGVCASHRDTLNSLDILGEGYETKVKQWRADLMPKIVQNKNVRLIIIIIVIYDL